MTTAREHAEQLIADRFQSGRLFDGIAGLAKHYSDITAEVWEPLLDEALGIIACASVDCPHGWQQEATAFMVKMATLLPSRDTSWERGLRFDMPDTEIPSWLLEAYDNVRGQLAAAMDYAARNNDPNGAAIIAIAQGRVEGVGIAAHHLVGDDADDQLMDRWLREYQVLPLTSRFNCLPAYQNGNAHSHPGIDHEHRGGDQPHEHQCLRDRTDL